MRGKLNDRDAKCPFFCAHTKESVICEGVIPDSRDKINFETSQGKKLHYAVFCCSHYKNCEKYAAVEQKYRE